MSTEPAEEYAQSIKGKTGLKRIINACGYSKDGLQAAYDGIHNMRVCSKSLMLFAIATGHHKQQ